MDIESFREYCLSLPDVTEWMPFGPDVEVFKVSGKIFTITPLDTGDFRFNVKCDPALALELREQYEGVLPGYHMNKQHWNTIIPDTEIPDRLLKEWVRHSYDLIVDSLPKKKREALRNGL